MKKSFVIVFSVVVMCSCELIDISKRQTIKHVNLTQDTPAGVVYLFLAEIDSANHKGASVLLADEGGKLMSADGKYERYEEMQRLKRLMKFTPVTNFKLDTLSSDKMKVKMQIDYFKNYSFITERINNNWYITNINLYN